MKKRNLIKTVALSLFSAVILSGCASMSYTGTDYKAENAGKVQTQEGFYFSTYTKSSADEGIDMTVGMTKSSLQDVTAVYVKVANKTTAPYAIYKKNFAFSSDSKTVSLVSPAQFVNAYQSQETGTYAGMQAIAPTIATIATISNNFQTDGQNQAVAQNNSQKSLNAQIESFVDGITKYSLASISVLKAGETKYFYLFLQTDGTYPVNMTYKDLKYTFSNKSTSL